MLLMINASYMKSISSEKMKCKQSNSSSRVTSPSCSAASLSVPRPVSELVRHLTAEMSYCNMFTSKSRARGTVLRIECQGFKLVHQEDSEAAMLDS